MQWLKWWPVLLAVLASSDAYRILVAFPFPSKSHGILGDGVVKHLLQAGHDVTYITPFLKTDPPQRLRQIDVSDMVLPAKLNVKEIMDGKLNMGDHKFIINMMFNSTRKSLMHRNVQQLLQDTREEFDLVIGEWMFSDVYCGLAAVFNCPYIWFFPFEHFSVTLAMLDELPNPAYTPSVLHAHEPPYDFVLRVKSLVAQVMGLFYKEFYFASTETEIYENAYQTAMAKRGRVLPSFYNLRFNASLALIFSHISSSEAITRPHNYIHVGGHHIDTEVKPLPEDLKKIMDEAKNGVIYFSLGSNLKSTDLPDQLKNDLLKMFGGLKQTVLWKFEEELADMPKNVHILKWAPQMSILAHPKCVLFITHGGLLSTTETIHFGIPIIGIPVFADQFHNVDKAVTKGFAKRVDISYTMTEDLRKAIDEVLTSRRYRDTVKQLSLIYHDRVVPPGRELVHWVEHVVRTRGAPHLRSPALLVPWYQKMYLDLAAVVLAVAIVLIRIGKIIICTKKKTSERKKKN